MTPLRPTRGVRHRTPAVRFAKLRGGHTWPIHTSRGHRSRRGTAASCPGLFDVEESARRVGNYKWAEMKLFEALGGWVATVPELDVKMRLGTHCYKHAWHAELWHKRLPELREMNPDRLTAAGQRRDGALRRRDDRARGRRT